jgi:hypothetical protein
MTTLSPDEDRDWKSSARRGLTTRRSSPLLLPSDLNISGASGPKSGKEGRIALD